MTDYTTLTDAQLADMGLERVPEAVPLFSKDDTPGVTILKILGITISIIIVIGCVV